LLANTAGRDRPYADYRVSARKNGAWVIERRDRPFTG
jgi:hypothetical protein